MQRDLKNAFVKGDTTEVIRIMDVYFRGSNYSLWHLFRDLQRQILYKLLGTTWQEIEASFRHIYEHNYTVMEIMRGMNIPLPIGLSAPAEFILNNELARTIQADGVDVRQLKKYAEQATRLQLRLDEKALRFEASRKINEMMKEFEESPEDADMLETIAETLKVLSSMVDDLEIQAAQNSFFTVSKEIYPGRNEKAGAGDEISKKWVENFKTLSQHFNVRVE